MKNKTVLTVVFAIMAYIFFRIAHIETHNGYYSTAGFALMMAYGTTAASIGCIAGNIMDRVRHDRKRSIKYTSYEPRPIAQKKRGRRKW